MLNEKLVLVDDDGKPIKTVDNLVNADNDSEVDEAFNETARHHLIPSNQKNKVEDYPRSNKSNSNKMDRVIELVCNENVKYSKLNANSELICATCNECMFDAIHDLRVLDFANYVNVRFKSKSAKRRTFTIDGNTCLLTRITSTKVVPLKKTTSKSVITQNPEVKVYSKRPKVTKSLGSSSKSKIVEFRISNNSKPNQSWGSNASDVPSSSLVDFKLFKLFSEAVATACITQNRSLIHKRHNKTPYELLHNKKPDLFYLHVFGALCYPSNDSDDLGKLKPKADIRIFIGYDPAKKAFRIYNNRTRLIIETMHVDFDELTTMASE
nr:retrovirus-related Pol polyprotein from transposon TNT 1-94 [Tanacetum cinerariifolium]